MTAGWEIRAPGISGILFHNGFNSRAGAHCCVFHALPLLPVCQHDRTDVCLLKPKGIPCHYVSFALFSARAETRRETLGYCMSFENIVWWNHTQIRKFTISCFIFFVQQHSKPPTEIDLDYIMIKKPLWRGEKKKKETEAAERLITTRKLSLLPSNLCHSWAHHSLPHHVHWQRRHITGFLLYSYYPF